MNDNGINGVEVSSINEFITFMEDYMNETYGKACKDVFTFSRLGRQDSENVYIEFSSQRFSNEVVVLKYNFVDKSYVSNYMEIFYHEPIALFMREVTDLIFEGESISFYYFRDELLDSRFDYTCSQEKFEQEHGASFYILIRDDSIWNTDEGLREAADIILEASVAAKLKLNVIKFYTLTELPEDKFYNFDDFVSKHSDTIVDHFNYIFD